jgi:hypothetical protein
VPKARVSKTGRATLGRFTSSGVATIGEALARSQTLSRIQSTRAGTRIRVTVRGRTKDGKRFKAKERVREFALKAGSNKKAGQLLHHMMGALGKEFFDARGRGYDMIDPKDRIEWTVEIVR